VAVGAGGEVGEEVALPAAPIPIPRLHPCSRGDPIDATTPSLATATLPSPPRLLLLLSAATGAAAAAARGAAAADVLFQKLDEAPTQLIGTISTATPSDTTASSPPSTSLPSAAPHW
jgi:hypothetical protein